jgi:hypothetical protein
MDAVMDRDSSVIDSAHTNMSVAQARALAGQLQDQLRHTEALKPEAAVGPHWRSQRVAMKYLAAGGNSQCERWRVVCGLRPSKVTASAA